MVNNEVEKVRHKVLDPAGAVERIAGEYIPYLRGDGLFSSISCFPDVHCPVIHRSWFVPIDSGKERDFAENTLRSEGYTAVVEDAYTCANLTSGRTCSVSGTKGNLSMRIDVDVAESLAPPTTNVSPKLWRQVSVALDYYWDK